MRICRSTSAVSKLKVIYCNFHVSWSSYSLHGTSFTFKHENLFYSCTGLQHIHEVQYHIESMAKVTMRISHSENFLPVAHVHSSLDYLVRCDFIYLLRSSSVARWSVWTFLYQTILKNCIENVSALKNDFNILLNCNFNAHIRSCALCRAESVRGRLKSFNLN